MVLDSIIHYPRIPITPIATHTATITIIQSLKIHINAHNKIQNNFNINIIHPINEAQRTQQQYKLM